MIREAESGDGAAIRRVGTQAFKRADEADLVERLRADGDMLFELVAVEDGAIVGHVALSNMRGDIGGLAGLGPIGVAPPRQKDGIGAALMRAAIARCRADGVRAIVLLGDPAYYARFGFTHDAAAKLQSRYAAHAAFQALELEPGVLAAGGIVQYAPAFGG